MIWSESWISERRQRTSSMAHRAYHRLQKTVAHLLIAQPAISKATPAPAFHNPSAAELEYELAYDAKSDTFRTTKPRFSSKRAQDIADNSPHNEYYLTHEQRRVPPHVYHPTQNANGYISLCYAENRMMFHLWADKLRLRPGMQQQHLEYDDWLGNPAFREDIARFLGERVFGRSVDWRHIGIAAGAAAVMNLVVYAICEPNDAILIPTPFYAGFEFELGSRNSVHIVQAHMSSDDGFRLRIEPLQEAFERAQGEGQNPRVLVITNPCNPNGRVYTKQELTAVIEWAEKRDLHIIFDELYAMSVFGSSPHLSAGRLLSARAFEDNQRLHVLYAFSKDFAASGFRVGLVYTHNPDVLKVIEVLAGFAACSTDTQFLLSSLLRDKQWSDKYFAEVRRLLARNYAILTKAFPPSSSKTLSAKRPCVVPAEGGIFALLDCRSMIREPTFAAERDLWLHFLNSANVNLTPGKATRFQEPGFFRCVFGSVTDDVLVIACERLKRAVDEWNAKA